MRRNLPIINSAVFPQARQYKIDQSIYSRWPENVKAANDDEKTITIYQEIGDSFFAEGFTARRMSAALRSIGKKNDVVVSINSPGGDFFEGATIYNLLREHEGKVTVRIPGLAASAASLIAMAGDEIQISEVGFYMIHNAWGYVVGNKNDMIESADTFAKFDAAMSDVYSARTGFDRDEIAKMMDRDTWMSGSEAINKGFADTILSNKSVVEDSSDDEKKSKAMAKRSLEVILAKQGLSRKERDELFNKAFGSRDATNAAARDAGVVDENQLTELLNTIKT